MKKTINDLRRIALGLGAKEAKVIPASTVKTASWVRYKCQFGCSGFGECLTCPPYSPTPEETQRIINFYKKAILLHTASGWKVDISKIVFRLEREAFLAGYYKALGMGAGPCRLCRTCRLKSGCRHLEEARPSMEACGIDVFSTVRSNGFKLETLDSFGCKANYYAIVFVE
jgi:predicted metal-binding protein